MEKDKELSQRFHNIIKQNKGILYKVARMYCQSETDRQDLFQEICIQIWRSLDKYNNKYKLSTWLYRISLNVAISYYRQNVRRHLTFIPIDEHISQLQEADDTEKEQHLILLEQFINELNDLDKALMLLYLEERSQAEIAEILGCSLSNVSTKAGRIKEKLRNRFSQLKSYNNE